MASALGEKKHAYERRRPEESALYSAVRENFATLQDELDEAGCWLPKFVQKELTSYLKCGILAHGFARVRCDGCKDEMLVGFSCKGRGLCPSCNSKRSHLTAAHLVENVLPQVAYRQWTLSYPIQLRWLLAKDAKLLSRVLKLCIRGLFTYQRKVSKRLGIEGQRQSGAVAFQQRFGSALQLTPHFHILMPDGIWVKGSQGEAGFHPLPPPSTEEVEHLLKKILRKALKLFGKLGLEQEENPPHSALELLQAHAVQRQFRWAELGLKVPKRKPRTTFIEGWSLHADTHVHERDRLGLERLCRYGSRGALSMERLSKREDAKPNSSCELVLTGVQLLKKLTALVPPSEDVPPTKEKGSVPDETTRRIKPPKLDWAQLLKRTFGIDVFTCQRCGSRRRVLAFIQKPSVALALLTSLGLYVKTPKTPLGQGQGPPRQLVLLA